LYVKIRNAMKKILLNSILALSMSSTTLIAAHHHSSSEEIGAEIIKNPKKKHQEHSSNKKSHKLILKATEITAEKNDLVIKLIRTTGIAVTLGIATVALHWKAKCLNDVDNWVFKKMGETTIVALTTALLINVYSFCGISLK
jgi:hypothetical protein